MALTTPQTLWARRQVVAEIFGTSPVNVTKAQIDAAIAACVTWAEDNATEAAAAMAGTALESATAAVKAEAVAIAIRARYGDI